VKPAWYLRRLASMSPAEVLQRTKDASAKKQWERNAPTLPTTIRPGSADAMAPLPRAVLDSVPDAALKSTVADADDLLNGIWPMFDRVRDDLAPDTPWFHCLVTGRTAPSTGYFASVPHRDENVVGNIKYVWEMSRHQHLTVLAAAYALTGDDRYAERVDLQLRSWLAQNPFLQGTQWTSAIEVGVRLISWVWLRRLLHGWSGTEDLFENNPDFVGQLWGHQAYLERFESHGTSANNHLLAEVAGLFAAACTFPWFEESTRWRHHAATVLKREVELQTFRSGLNKELASEYHGFVLELVLAALIEGEISGNSLGPVVWEPTTRMFDALAATVDVHGEPPRQGDADEGHGLLLSNAHYPRWDSLLATGANIVGTKPWWPSYDGTDLRAHVWASLVDDLELNLGSAYRPARRPSHFRDAGVTILRDHATDEAELRPDELWCRIDHGPHGFLATAGHAHADALSFEVRHGGVEILADPGTYCYHGEPEWREYFRSTVGHNCLELLGRDQSQAEGPFLWSKHATGIIDEVGGLHSGDTAYCAARHDGYRSDGLMHHRLVEIDRTQRKVIVVDNVEGATNTPCRLGLHFGPTVDVELDSSGTRTVARLRWSSDLGDRSGEMTLDDSLVWSLHRGEEQPIFGWYSKVFGDRRPTFALVGTGTVNDGHHLRNTLTFADGGTAEEVGQ
jgi:hypothetical protein